MRVYNFYDSENMRIYDAYDKNSWWWWWKGMSVCVKEWLALPGVFFQCDNLEDDDDISLYDGYIHIIYDDENMRFFMRIHSNDEN